MYQLFRKNAESVQLWVLRVLEPSQHQELYKKRPVMLSSKSAFHSMSIVRMQSPEQTQASSAMLESPRSSSMCKLLTVVSCGNSTPQPQDETAMCCTTMRPKTRYVALSVFQIVKATVFDSVAWTLSSQSYSCGGC